MSCRPLKVKLEIYSLSFSNDLPEKEWTLCYGLKTPVDARIVLELSLLEVFNNNFETCFHDNDVVGRACFDAASKIIQHGDEVSARNMIFRGLY